MVDIEKVRYPSLHTHTHTHQADTNTNTVVALAQAEIEIKLELQVGARLTDREMLLQSQEACLVSLYVKTLSEEECEN